MHGRRSIRDAYRTEADGPRQEIADLKALLKAEAVSSAILDRDRSQTSLKQSTAPPIGALLSEHDLWNRPPTVANKSHPSVLGRGSSPFPIFRLRQLVRKPTQRAFGTRGATDIAAAAAIEPIMARARRMHSMPRGSKIGLIVKCAVAVWVVAVLYAVLWDRGPHFL